MGQQVLPGGFRNQMNRNEDHLKEAKGELAHGGRKGLIRASALSRVLEVQDQSFPRFCRKYFTATKRIPYDWLP